MNDQVFYKRDLPAKSIEPIKIKASHLAAGTYQLQVYKVGYRSNDAYATYLDLKSPLQLTRADVAKIKEQNNGSAIITAIVHIPANGIFEKQLPMRQNDVYFVTLQHIKNSKLQ